MSRDRKGLKLIKGTKGRETTPDPLILLEPSERQAHRDLSALLDLLDKQAIVAYRTLLDLRTQLGFKDALVQRGIEELLSKQVKLEQLVLLCRKVQRDLTELLFP